MTRPYLVLLTCCGIALAGCMSSGPGSLTPEDVVPLDTVIAQVEEALNLYQSNIGNGPRALPPLASAEFDFKACATSIAGGTVNLIVLKIGGTYQTDFVQDVTFTYKVPPPPPHPFRAEAVEPLDLKETLVSTIQSAAKVARTMKTVGRLPLNNVVVSIQFGVKREASGGVSAPISFATLGLNGGKNNSRVQTVKLVFQTGT